MREVVYPYIALNYLFISTKQVGQLWIVVIRPLGMPPLLSLLLKLSTRNSEARDVMQRLRAVHFTMLRKRNHTILAGNVEFA